MEVWGLRAVDLKEPPRVMRSLSERGAAPEAAPLAAAPKEFLMRRLGHELSRATRLVNRLEQQVEVNLRHQLSVIRRTLEEREREEHLRLKRLIARRKGTR